MLRVISVCAIALTLVSGCARISESRLNPMNLFSGKDRPERVEDIRPIIPAEKVVQTVDARALVARISELEITPTLGGIIVRASGVATAAGAYSAELTTASISATELVLDFRAFQGEGSGDGRISVARFLSNQELGSVRRIQVRSASGALSRSR